MSEKRILRDRSAVISKISVKGPKTSHVCNRKSNEKENFVSHMNIKEASDKNQKPNVSGRNSFKSKDKLFNKNIESKKNPVLCNVENIYSEKNIPTKKRSTDIKLNLKKVPIWKQNQSVLKSNRKRRYVDVYDITLDDELEFSKEKIKNEKICLKKNKKKVNYAKKKQHFHSNKHQNSVIKKLCFSKPVCIKPVSEKDKTATKLSFQADKLIISQTVPSKQSTCDTEVHVEQNDEQNTFYAEACIKQNDEQNLCISSLNDTIETIVQWPLTDLQSSKSQDESKTYLSNLADELEKSFSVPIMTSTPDDIHSKTKIQMKQNKIINSADISNIPANNKNFLNSTLASPVISDNVSPQRDKDIEEITLFESPEKENDKAAQVSPQKRIQINLFGEVLRTPSSTESSEDSVLMAKKAYHTPDNFKRHLIRTKKPAEKIKKEPKKSKQDLLIEKMSQHFDEISKTELCIE